MRWITLFAILLLPVPVFSQLGHADSLVMNTIESIDSLHFERVRADASFCNELEENLDVGFYLDRQLVKILYDSVLADSSLPSTRCPLNLTSHVNKDELFLFSHLDLQWDPVRKAFIATGEMGLELVGGKTAGKYVNGVIELWKKDEGDRLCIYFENTKGTWFFFQYSDGLMEVISSVAKFNERISRQSVRERKVKGNPPYEYVLGSETCKTLFLKKSGFWEQR